MKKVVAHKIVHWDGFNLEHECCRTVVSGRFRRLMTREDGSIVYMSDQCSACKKSWTVVTGKTEEANPYHVIVKEFENKAAVPTGWVIS